MGFKPTTGEKVAYFVVVVVLITSILSGTYFFLRRRNKRFQSQRSPSIRLTRQDEAPPITQDLTRGRGFETTRAPPLPSMPHRSASRATDGNFTAEWAREQAFAAARGEARPLTIYPESSISSAPWQFPPPQHEPPRGRQLSTRSQRTRSPIRSISPLTRRLQAETRHLAQWPPRSDSLTDIPSLPRIRHQPSYVSLTPSFIASPDPEALTLSPPPPATSPPHQIYTLHLNRPRLIHAPSHYSADSPDRDLHRNQPDTFSNPHRGPPSPSPYHHPEPTPSPSSPQPSTATTDVARCVNPYYLSSTLARRAARPPTSRKARWSAFGLGSDPGTNSEVGGGEMLVRGRAPVVEIDSPAMPAPLRVARGREGSEGKGGNGRGQDEVEEMEVRRQVVYRAESRAHGANEARGPETLMPVGYGGMF